jgi:hypothetical protein
MRDFLCVEKWNDALRRSYPPGVSVPSISDITSADIVQAMQSGIVGVVVDNQAPEATQNFHEMHKDVQGPTNNIAIRWFNGPRDKGGVMLATVFFKH